MVSTDHPAADELRAVVHVLATGEESINSRLQAAERLFSLVGPDDMRSDAERHLHLRIGAGLVEGGDEDSSIDESIASLDEARASEIAEDMVRLFEVVVALRSDDGYQPVKGGA
jgi:hypothetical protein